MTQGEHRPPIRAKDPGQEFKLDILPDVIIFPCLPDGVGVDWQAGFKTILSGLKFI